MISNVKTISFRRFPFIRVNAFLLFCLPKMSIVASLRWKRKRKSENEWSDFVAGVQPILKPHITYSLIYPIQIISVQYFICLILVRSFLTHEWWLYVRPKCVCASLGQNKRLRSKTCLIIKKPIWWQPRWWCCCCFFWQRHTNTIKKKFYCHCLLLSFVFRGVFVHVYVFNGGIFDLKCQAFGRMAFKIAGVLLSWSFRNGSNQR